MGVTPAGSEAQPLRASTAAGRDGATAAKTDTRSKFEEAMRRMRDGDPHPQDLADGEGLSPFDPPVLLRHPHAAGDDRNGGELAHGLAGPAAAQPAGAAAEGGTISGSPADIAPSHYEFLSRIGLSSHRSGAETQLTMSDQRWLASHAVVRRDDSGGLSVEIQTRSDADADAEQQRHALQTRLEARGHRITSMLFDR